MAFTQAELDNIAVATLDYHMKEVHPQSLQSRPLLRALEKRQREFSGGRDFITVRVKGAYSTVFQGYTHNDVVTYGNPANLKEAQYPWKELHAGITVTLTELKKNGIHIVDTENGRRESSPGDVERFQLVNLLEDKMDDMSEGSARDFHKMLYLDGTQDVKEVPGIRSLILNAPATAGQTVGGIPTDTNAWWRNRAVLGMNTATADILASTFSVEMRQLRRYTSKAAWEMFAGSDFLTALEAELRAKGTYTDSGWAGKGGIDMSMDDIRYKSMKFQYDPALDELGLAKYCFVLDLNAIRLRPMTGEAYKKHFPARPETIYAIYRAITWTGGLVASQLNTSGIYSIA